MAEYRALDRLYANGRIIEANEAFRSNETPGAAWHPLDDDAKAAVEAKAAPAAPASAPAADSELVADLQEEIADLREDLAEAQSAAVAANGEAEKLKADRAEADGKLVEAVKAKEAAEFAALQKDEEIAGLKAEVAKFDKDGDGKVGGSAKKA